MRNVASLWEEEKRRKVNSAIKFEVINQRWRHQKTDQNAAADPKERPTFFQLAEMVEKYIESLVGLDYMNGLESENDLIGVKVERTEPIQHE
jgi:hypothetical protein